MDEVKVRHCQRHAGFPDIYIIIMGEAWARLGRVKYSAEMLEYHTEVRYTMAIPEVLTYEEIIWP